MQNGVILVLIDTLKGKFKLANLLDLLNLRFLLDLDLDERVLQLSSAGVLGLQENVLVPGCPV